MRVDIFDTSPCDIILRQFSRVGILKVLDAIFVYANFFIFISQFAKTFKE